MEHGLIRISEPFTYSEHECIHISKGQIRALCVLKGRILNKHSNKVFNEGDVIKHIFLDGEKDFEVLEEAMIITIDCDEMDKKQPIVEKILDSTMKYITELRAKLIVDNPSIRP